MHVQALRAAALGGAILLGGCGRFVLPALILGARADVDLDTRRRTRLTAQAYLDFRLDRPAPAAAAPSGKGPVPDPPLAVPCGTDALCRYARDAAARAWSRLSVAP